MDVILPAYHVSNATWFYLSFLLIVAVFFRFGRIWSLRNLDIALLLSISPGLLLVAEGREAIGYAWLFSITSLFLLRLFFDGLFARRPLLEQNLNIAGMTFLCIASFSFLMTKVMTEPPPSSTVETVGRADDFLQSKDVSAQTPKPVDTKEKREAQPGPASSLLAAPATLTAKVVASASSSPSLEPVSVEQVAARILAVLAHIAVISGLIMMASIHFHDIKIGVAMAVLYLLLPCTAYDVQKVNHVLPSALIVWAFVAHRRPMVAGSLMGLACGTLFFPIFLLPLWLMFYGRRGSLRFGLALIIVGAVLLGSLARTSVDPDSFTRHVIGSIDWSVLKFSGGEAAGFWSSHDAAYRTPVVAGFLVMLVLLTVFPWRKNLEHLLSHSTAIVIGTQFWYPQQGGVYLLWYLPLLLIVVFRPKLVHLASPDVGTKTSTQQNAPQSHKATMTMIGNNRQFR